MLFIFCIVEICKRESSIDIAWLLYVCPSNPIFKRPENRDEVHQNTHNGKTMTRRTGSSLRSCTNLQSFLISNDERDFNHFQTSLDLQHDWENSTELK